MHRQQQVAALGQQHKVGEALGRLDRTRRYVIFVSLPLGADEDAQYTRRRPRQRAVDAPGAEARDLPTQPLALHGAALLAA